jgi:hypothetical protein
VSGQSFGRRRFLAYAGALAAAPVPAAAGAREAAAAREPAAATEPAAAIEPTALSKREMEVLIALLSRLIPSDAQSGGAVEANAHIYIDRALSGAHSKHLPLYRENLHAIDVLARSEAAGTAAFPPERLDSLLARLEAGESSKGFFALLLRHTIEGMFSDPIHGGNHGYIGWTLVGYPGIRLFSSDADQALDAHSPEEHRSVADFGRRES